MERKKFLRTQDKAAGLEPNGYDLSTNLEQTNKTLPTGEVISIVDAGEQFIKEREESHLYRLTATLKPTIFYPQDFYWFGNPTGDPANIEFGITSSSETSPLDINEYALPNLLNPTTPSPTEEQMRLDKTDNWITQLLRPDENEYLKLYNIPEFSVNIGFVPEPDDARYGIDTGIHAIIYQQIAEYLDTNINGTTFESWFNGSSHVLQIPFDGNGDPIPGETLRINNQNIQGYTQDGIPFLFSVPVQLQSGWFTALYVPFEHNFEEGDFIFVKTIASTGNIPGVGDTNDIDNTCDPSLYGIHRVIAPSWEALGSKYDKHYVIVEHKSQYHDEWVNNTSGVSYPFTVESSQGFLKRVRNYSPESVVSLFAEPISATSLIPQPGPDNVNTALITTSAGPGTGLDLQTGDQILLTISTDAPGTFFQGERRPLSFNLSGIYTVLDFDTPPPGDTIRIRSSEMQDTVDFFNGLYTLNDLVALGNVSIEVYKFINATPSEYYLKKGKIITTINDINVNKLPFSEGYYGDTNYSVVVENDIDIETMRDNHQRPISELYLATVKRAGQQPYDFTDVEAFFSWAFTQSSLIVKTDDGLEIASKRTTLSTDPGYVRDINGGYMDNVGEDLGNSYYINFSEYNLSTLVELEVETIKHRFNTFDRECADDNCNEIILAEQEGFFAGWQEWNSNTCSLTTTGDAVLGITLSTLDDPNCESLSETSPTSGSFIYETFTITADQVDQEMVLEFEFTQISSTGVVRIIKPNGSLMPFAGSTGVYPGDSGAIDGNGQTNQYVFNFTPDTIGDYTLLLGIMGWSGSYTTTGTFSGRYNQVKISRYFGTPQYGAWIYDPFGKYTIKRFSQFLETADPTVIDIPYYATFISGLYLWRDLLTLGFFEDIDRTQGVDYPFLNGKHYIDIDKHFLIGLTPYSIDENTLTTVIFGCMDLTATNYLSYATVPCGPSEEQNGPCVGNLAGQMQSLLDPPPTGSVYNPLGCCCAYEESGTGTYGSSESTVVFLRESTYADIAGDNTNAIRYGDLHTGWNMCQGYYPYWKDAPYWGDNLCGAYNSTDPNNPHAGLRGVVTGVDNPPFRSPVESGELGADIFRYENYVTGGNVNLQFLQKYGDLVPDPANNPNTPWYNNYKGRQETADDPDNEFKIIGGNNTSNPSQWSGVREQTIEWSSNETVTNPNGDTCTETPLKMNTGYFYFYKFDTSNCKTCYDKGNASSPNPDANAPRHGWPVDVDTNGNANNDYFTIGSNPTQVKIPKFMGYNWGQAPARRYKRVYCGVGGNDVDFGSAGLLQNSVYGSLNTNIAAYRDESDPWNWRFQYANVVHTWGCDEAAFYGEFPFSASWSAYGANAPMDTQTESLFFTCKNEGANYTDYTSHVKSCTLPTVGKAEQYNNGWSASYGTYAGFAQLNNAYPPAIEQPTIFEPDLPNDGQEHHYEFRGRVNVEMAIAADLYETYYNAYQCRGWHLAPTNPGDDANGPLIRYNTSDVGADPTQATIATQIADMAGLASTLNISGAYKDYARLYAGFWIGVVSHTDKVTYIYDADDGTSGDGVATVLGNPIYQSDGAVDFTNVPWLHGCGGFDFDGNPVATKMGYSPCFDSAGFSNSDCTTGWNATDGYNPKKDDAFTAGEYLPSCGESGSSANKSDFQKQWSQSFRSGPIPMRKGDQAFIYIRTVGGTLRAVHTFDPAGWDHNSPQGLPTYWAARQID